MAALTIATWNVNSLRARLPVVLRWLASAKPHILALQEIKCENKQFPLNEIAELGYQAIWAGQKTYNGVALLSRQGCEAQAVETDLPGQLDSSRRLLAATFMGIRLINVYVPNGESLTSDKFPFKLHWLVALKRYLQAQLALYPKLIVLGDFNIAPQDMDVFSVPAWQGKVLVSPAERQALADLLSLGLSDIFRMHNHNEKIFSWWDYRAASFVRNKGLRIDLILASQAVGALCQSCTIDKTPRSWEKPSDHTPVVAEFNLDPG